MLSPKKSSPRESWTSREQDLISSFSQQISEMRSNYEDQLNQAHRLIQALEKEVDSLQSEDFHQKQRYRQEMSKEVEIQRITEHYQSRQNELTENFEMQL